jgi:hypothetical protein
MLDILPQGGIPRMRDGYWIFGLGFVPSSFVLFSLDIGYSPALRDPANAGRFLDIRSLT